MGCYCDNKWWKLLPVGTNIRTRNAISRFYCCPSCQRCDVTVQVIPNTETQVDNSVAAQVIPNTEPQVDKRNVSVLLK